MALVAYDFSDCSDIEDENDEVVERCSEKIQSVHEESGSSFSSNARTDTLGNLFSSLPKPSSQLVTEEDDEFLHKNEYAKKERAKINIPSLSDFKDVEDIPNKNKFFQNSGKKSGLLSILPEPKFSANPTKKPSKPLIPNVVEKKIIKRDPCPPVSEKASTSNTIKSTVKSGISFLSADYSDSDEDPETQNNSDFFSINATPDPIVPAADDISYLQTVQQTKETIEETGNVLPIYQENNLSPELSSQQINMPSQSTQIELDDEAIRQLCGSRNKHRKEEISMITVDQKQVLSDSREWLLKGLMDDTTKRVSASKRRGNEPTNQQRKKHQITYLAHQAKANEAELQNQWANNRVSKRQTQSKYGF